MLRTPISHLPEPRAGQGTEGRARALLDAMKASEPEWITRLLVMEYREDEKGNPVRGQMLRETDGRRNPTIDPETEALRRAKIRASLKGRRRPADVVEKIARANRARAIKRARSVEPTRMSNYKPLTLTLGRRLPFEDDGR
jgi:hypothetical protein